MHEDHPQKKKRLGLLKRSSSNHNLSDERGSRTVTGSETSLHSSSRTRGLFGKLFGKGTKSSSAQNARQSLNAASLTPKSRERDLSTQTDREPSKPTALAPHPNLGQDTSSSTTVVQHQVEASDPNERIADAQKAIAGMKGFSGMVQNTASEADNVQSGLDMIDQFSSIVEPLKVFNSIADVIGKIHPYAQVVMSIFTCASKMILDQAQLDNDVRGLVEKVSEVYTFMNEDGRLAAVPSMQELFGKLARQTLECSDFIVHYSEIQSAWKRMGKHIFKETDGKVQSFSKVLDGLMLQFQERAARQTVIDVYRMADDLDFMDMVYVDGTGRDTSKRCLPGTREGILSEIKDWVDNIGEDLPRVLWLSGTAGKGKSAIAHTIANWFLERGDPGACFCFDRTREADYRHEKIFSTIARDLADHDPIIRRALASAVRDNNELRHTTDITRQWKKFVLGPVGAASQAVAAPVLMVIDALDESGEVRSRERILQMLAGKLDPDSSEPMKLPANIRILVTSRPLDDISVELDAAPHVRHVSMDDLPAESTENDIRLYISKRLPGPRNAFEDEHFKKLAQKADGLFEWARLACEYIKGTNKAGVDPMDRFEDVIAGTSESQIGTHLLDDMYHRILAEIIPEDAKAIARVRSVMAQVLGSLEPLSMSALTAMRRHFPGVSASYKVELVIVPLGSLLAGTTDSHSPIRPLHASFYDFLTDVSRSKKFFIDKSLASSGLAFASLRVMKAGLRFNMCSLESSYLPNSAVPGLEQRVKESIPPELSYSCRFWGTHVRIIAFDPSLAKEVKAFLDEERLLFWLEALSLLKGVGGSLATLSCIADWLKGHVEYTDIADSVRDTQRFVRTFAPAIVHSTPHLYLSALPFAPTQSRIFRTFAEKFPRTPRVAAGHVIQWPLMEKIVHLNSEVYSIAVSPDGRCVVSGSKDGMIRVWDTETGEALGAFQGHTGLVRCVTISPDGRRVVSCSDDPMIRLWDVDTGKAVGDPLLGHVSYVSSIAVSPDGHRIVSGSGDRSIRVWDADTGEALGAFQGHTDSVQCVTISPDGRRIVSSSWDQTIRLWDADTGRAVGDPLLGHSYVVLSIAVSPDGHRIVCGSTDSSIRVWNADTGEALGAPLKGHTGWVASVAISPDGTRIVSGSEDTTIRIWDIETGMAWGAPILGHTRSVNSVAFSPDGKRIVSGSGDQTIRIWDMDTGMAVGAPQAAQEHTGGIDCLAILSDGTRFVSSSDQLVWVWNVDTAKPLGVPIECKDLVASVTLSPDGKHFITGYFDGTVQVWDTETGVALGVPHQGHTDVVTFIVISTDGKRFVSGSDDNTIRVWDADTGEALGASLQGHNLGVWCAAISPDGNRVVSGAVDWTILVWDIETGRTIGEPLQGHTNAVISVAISPDGKHIVSGSDDKTILVWDMETGRAMGGPLQGHTGGVTSVAVSPDGKHIVSGSRDWTIRVWDMETRRAIGAPFRGHTNEVMSVAISPDGKNIMSGSWDWSFRAWAFDSFLKQSRGSEAPAIVHFSSNPTHALCSASSFLDNSRTPSSLAPTEEGWVVGPQGRLLLWIPMNFHPVMYVPCNTLVISNDVLQLDLSHFAHGASWQMCRE